MSNYLYKCFDCGKSYDKDKIEKNLIYLCPVCGKVEKNQPLKGILSVEYEYDLIRKKISRDELLELPSGKFWLYSDLWPIDFSNPRISTLVNQNINRLSLPSESLLQFSFDDYYFSVLDETRNPTLSYKDRASSIVALKALELGINEIAAASTGNAGSSMAGICSRLGLKSVIFVPKNIPDAKRIQIQSYGAQLFMVDGDYDLAFDTCYEIATEMNWYNRNTAFNPLTIEGKKSSAYDIFISLKGRMPELIFVPCGDGVIISGLYKGLRELFELGWIEIIPKLIAVQTEGSDAIVRYFRSREFEYKPAHSIADSLCAGAPRSLITAYSALIHSDGNALSVSDAEIMEAQKIIAQRCGIIAEPAAAASFAGYKKYFSDKSLNKNVLLLLTGNGLKDTSSLQNWNTSIKALSPLEIKSIIRN